AAAAAGPEAAGVPGAPGVAAPGAAAAVPVAAAAAGGGANTMQGALAARLGVAADNVSVTTKTQVDGAGNWFAKFSITTSDAQEITNLANNGIKVEAGVTK